MLLGFGRAAAEFSAVSSVRQPPIVHGSKSVPTFAGLYGFDVVRDHPLDVMHLVRNFCGHIFNIFKGKTLRPKKNKTKRGEGESDEEYKARCDAKQAAYAAKEATYAPANAQLRLMSLDSEQQEELERRYATVLAPVGLKGRGKLFAKGCYMTAAEWYFFIKYCSTWIFVGLVPEPALTAVTLLFQVAIGSYL